jgi:hypothetical protein|tara:strand:- start:432 stop:887 length:456 start_codon:yes stop_codon:yes gene_type:complete
MQEEMRYWPRLGIYVNRIDAESYCAKLGGQHTVVDDDLEEFVPVSTHEPEAIKLEVEMLFNAPPIDAVPSQEIQTMIDVIKFEEQRVSMIKKWIKEDGMEKQDAKDKFQKQMDLMVRDALNLPEETELEKAHRAKAAANLAAIKDAEDEEE